MEKFARTWCSSSCRAGCGYETLHAGFFGGRLQNSIHPCKTVWDNIVWIRVESQDRRYMNNSSDAWLYLISMRHFLIKGKHTLYSLVEGSFLAHIFHPGDLKSSCAILLLPYGT